MGERSGWRNAQASVLAPTGTIGLMMDCDTTGIEPDLALVKVKKLVGGASMQIVNHTVPRALTSLGYTGGDQRGDRRAHQGARPRRRCSWAAPGALRGLRLRARRAFDRPDGSRADDGGGSAVPVRCDQQDGQHADVGHRRRGRKHLLRGLEARAQGARDLPRQLQGRSAAQRPQGQPGGREAAARPRAHVESRPVRKRLPKKRPSQTISFAVGGAEGYLTAGSYPDNGLGEVFIKMSKQGSTLAGVMDAFSVAVSIALQYGVPLDAYVSKFINMRFDPAGLTDDPDVRLAQSVMDYLFRRLALDYLPYERRAELGIFTAEERAAQTAAASTATRRPSRFRRCRRRVVAGVGAGRAGSSRTSELRRRGAERPVARSTSRRRSTPRCASPAASPCARRAAATSASSAAARAGAADGDGHWVRPGLCSPNVRAWSRECPPGHGDGHLANGGGDCRRHSASRVSLIRPGVSIRAPAHRRHPGLRAEAGVIGRAVSRSQMCMNLDTNPRRGGLAREPSSPWAAARRADTRHATC